MARTSGGGGVVVVPSGILGMVPMPTISPGSGQTGSDGNPLAQRPLFNSGTNVLTWQGPVGGGPSNGDYTLQTRTLTSRGSLTTTSNGQIIEGFAIVAGDGVGTTNPIIVQHNNVTIRQCYLQYSPANVDENHCIRVDDNTTGLIVEDCLMDGNATSNEGNGITGWNATNGNYSFAVTGATVRRNQFLRCGQAIHYTMNHVSFTENYCGTFSGGDADWFECYPNGGSCDNLFVQYNYFTGPDDSVAGSDSGVNFSPGAGLPKGNIGPNITVDSCWFVWNYPNTGAFPFHSLVNGIGGGTGTGTEQLEFTFTNNGIFNVNGYAGAPGMFGSASSGNPLTGGGLVHDSGLYKMATTTARTGVAWVGANGAGRL